jgi:hypothetical protein
MKARYLVELTGELASNLQEFVRVLEKADSTTLFYHVYHPLLQAHLVPYEYPNDFSFWFSDSLQDKDLAEQVANIEFPGEGGLEELRQNLLSKISKAAERYPDFRVHPGNEFHFVRCRYVVFPTGVIAKTLDELADGLSSAQELSVFYHLVTSRVFGRSKYDDFSNWILKNTTDAALAEKLRRIDPTTHMNVRTLQKEALDVFQSYLREKRRMSRQ